MPFISTRPKFRRRSSVAVVVVVQPTIAPTITSHVENEFPPVSSHTWTLPTINAGDFVVVQINGYSYTSLNDSSQVITSPNLTFTKGYNVTGQGALYYARATAALTNELMTSAGSNMGNCGHAYSFANVDVSNPFDAVVGQFQGSAGPQTLSITTNFNNSLVIAQGFGGYDAGWTQLGGGPYDDRYETKVLTTASTVTTSFSGTTQNNLTFALKGI
jgi:hypothetical protein